MYLGFVWLPLFLKRTMDAKGWVQGNSILEAGGKITSAQVCSKEAY